MTAGDSAEVAEAVARESSQSAHGCQASLSLSLFSRFTIDWQHSANVLGTRIEVCRGWPAERLEKDMETATKHGIRVIANTVTHIAWRNGPVESVHAGEYRGYGLDERRVPAKAEKAIFRKAQDGFFSGLKAVDRLKYSEAWPPPAERVLPFLHGLVGPTGWSCTESSRVVELPLR